MSTITDRHRTRRPHRKSRAGCHNCKQRRVKCDELKPICGNCSRFSIPCGFSPHLCGSEKSKNILPDVPIRRKRGRPRKDWSAITRDSAPHGEDEVGESSETTGSSPGPSLIKGPISSPQLTVDELELLYHYLTDPNFSHGDKLMWQVKVPRLAFSHHYVLHLILAVSAFHLMRVDPSRAEHFRKLADTHHSIGIRQATKLFPQLSTENCAPLYVAAVFACACGFAKEPTPGNLLIIAEGCEVPWLDLLRGVRLIVENIGLEHVFCGVLGPFPPPEPKEPTETDEYQVDFVSWEEPLQKLSALVSTAPSSAQEIYNSTFECLTWCFHETYGTSTAPKSLIFGQLHVIMAWIYKLDEGFVEFIRQKQSTALIILAYFCILLSSLEYYWFLQGWANHICRGITNSLDPSYEHWLEWPREQIEKSLKSRIKKRRASS
ncbi:uncharacterized protein F4812DRAFT_413317 [Daldinia caldariorum]|uniref:uncharacterized protein n=1 Tax=Daldinia caldariorum TaxID=326644 RepID=UPI0020084191|nr:uncharacterized protein F4812DRAFT_413317 [Daldinia caldariorum]KAI1471261.1 hypothetical protein F4812DRAFT_413317 [Daldinia caldariorum]